MKQPKFEEALEKLEKIVGELEAGELSLDESLKRFEEGVRLARMCSKRLQEAEKKIEIVRKREDGSLETEDFEAAEGQEEGIRGPRVSTGGKGKRKPPRPEKQAGEGKDEEESLFS